MARVETGVFRHPMETLGHALHDTPAWLGRHWKSLTLALAAIGGSVIAVSQLARPYTPDTQARNTTPVSDPGKPPEERVGIVVVDNQSAQPAPVVAKDIIVEQPVISPLEKAIQAGRIELNNQVNSLGIATTKTDIASFLEAANRNAKTDQEFKFILPLDLHQTPNLMLTDLEYPVPRGKTRALGIKNIPSGTTFGSMIKGEARFLPGAAGGGTLAIAFELTDEHGNKYAVIARREGARTSFPPKEWVKVDIGDPLFSLGTEEPLGFYKEGQQVVMQFSHSSSDTWAAGVANLALAQGRLIYPSTGN